MDHKLPMLRVAHYTQLLLLLLLLVCFGLFLGRTWPSLAPIHWLYLFVGIMVATVAILLLLGIIYAQVFFLISAVMISLVAVGGLLLLFAENATSDRDQ